MKSVLIERVSNGWIVRPFTSCSDWARADAPVIAVYTRIEDLQADPLRLVADNDHIGAQDAPDTP